ncbi:hypothetical protein ACRQFD_03930 [Actinotignum sp. GS-2025c]|uniref:Uncharacterized protein n=1 Tax=Propionimicrobium lymphophilum ACS-093-V-SCH5 TaxID=883161 RepID=S2WLS6_9ACTN|nr:hypothetical protein [Propionimicrobium lymphophilum]EPD33627.1 hypothetical protein HMPREF9306_00382 [Propionimicrobium lymphophilum ACS-093-V-SCH5]
MGKKTTTTNAADSSRSATITIGGQDYELVLTTRATRLIAQRYGGLEHLGDALETSEDVDKSLGEVIWLITLLANQSVQIHNLTHTDDQRTELTEDAVELLTVPADLADYRAAISEALQRGTRRAIATEALAPKDQTKDES